MIGQAGEITHLCAAGMTNVQSLTVAQQPVGLRVISWLPLQFFDEINYGFSVFYVKHRAYSNCKTSSSTPVLANLASVPAGAGGTGAPGECRPHPSARPRPCRVVETSDSANELHHKP